MSQKLQELLAIPVVRAAALMVASILAALVVNFIVQRVLLRLTKRTKTELDDKIVTALRRPIFLTAIFVGVYWATQALRAQLSDISRVVVHGAIATLAIVLWAAAVIRVGGMLLSAMSSRDVEGALVKPSSLPLFDILLKLLVVVVAVYFMFLSWRIDLTAWMASAGIIGIAVGFGAKDTLSNLFAGIFIIADAPYKVGDFIALDDGLRGRVTNIGMRSTRILTLDDVEITVPNGLIGNSRIVNEAGGPHPKQRLHVGVSAAYGSDIDDVSEVLLGVVEGISQVCSDPLPETRLVEFGASGLEFRLLVWVNDPAERERVRDLLHRRVYKAFAKAGIEIPYSKLDVYIKETQAKAAAQS